MANDQPAARARVKTAVVVGFVLSLPLMVSLYVLRPATNQHTTQLFLADHQDGRVVVTNVGSYPRGDVVGWGMVIVTVDEERLGWPAATTIRIRPAAIRVISNAGGGPIGGPVPSAHRRAITDAVRQSGDTVTLKALEAHSTIVERRWWGWLMNLLTCWAVAAWACHFIHTVIDYVGGIRSDLRTWEGQCPSCSYDLSGCPEGSQCSECGATLPERARYWAARKDRARS